MTVMIELSFAVPAMNLAENYRKLTDTFKTRRQFLIQLATNKITSFPPIVDHSARILILGSMPGETSLRAAQYYAHPRNSFWKIMGSILGFNAADAYTLRLAALQRSGIALWDVLHSCVRQGSLDAAIESRSIIANDFNEFLPAHPCITRVYFNGTAAERYFTKQVLPTLHPTAIHLQRLPSTSPAHASLSLAAKTEIWRKAIGGAV